MATNTNDMFSPLCWRSMQFNPPKEPEYLVYGLIRCNTIVSFTSPGGLGKTMLLLELCKCLTEGLHFLNTFAVKKSTVLYIDGENGTAEMYKRGNHLGIDKDNPDFYLIHDFDGDLGNDASVNELFKATKRYGVNVVIIDTFRALCGKLNEFDAVEVRQFYKRFYNFREAGITVIFLDHTRKPQMMENRTANQNQIYGSQDKVAAIDMAFVLQKSKQQTDDGLDIIEVHQVKNRSDKQMTPFGFVMKDNDNGTLSLAYARLSGEESAPVKAKTKVLELLSESSEAGLTSKELIDALSGTVGKNNIEGALRELSRNGQIAQSVTRPPRYTLIVEDDYLPNS